MITHHNILTRVLSLVLIVAFPVSTVIAETNSGAVLNSNGAVTVNSTTVTKSAVVYQGDLVSTAEGSASITSPGSSLSLSPNSKIVYRGKGLDLSSGTVAVSTKTGMVAQAGQISIRPANQSTTRYELTVDGGVITAHASLGNLMLEVAGKSSMLAEGSTETFSTKPGNDQPTIDSKASEPATPVKRRRIAPVWIWSGVGAAAGAALLGIAAAGSHASVSPSQP